MPNLVQTSSADPTGNAGPAGRAVLQSGAVLLAITVVCYGAFVATHRTNAYLNPVDLRVFLRGARDAVHGGSLYNWPGTTNLFTYPPFAALIFTVLTVLPWHVALGLWTLASFAALAATIWVTLGALGYRATEVRAGGTLLFTAVLFWTAPVLHVVYLGQVELLLMALVMWDLCQPERRWWQGAGVGIAAGVKLVPLVFIPYFLLTRRYRQAAVAAGTFAGTVALGFAALPSDSRSYWLDGLFVQGSRIGFIGRDVNQSLPGLITRLAGSVAAGRPVWLVVSVLTLIIGVVCAALLYHGGEPVAGTLTCALTGLLVSPVSWDHHWVWIVPIVVALACYGLRSGGLVRCAWLGGAVLATGLFGAWPALIWGQPRYVGDFFEGLIWWPPGTTNAKFLRLGDRPGYAEYHWHGWELVVGNLMVLTGVVLLLLAACLAVRSAVLRRRQLPAAEVAAVSPAPAVGS